MILTEHGTVQIFESDEAFTSWQSALIALIGTRERLFAWQERRYEFANAVGRLLSGRGGGTPLVTGHALYGIVLPEVGVCYVGQTKDAQRRLFDLPIGESHHVPTTIPPEAWERVIVIQWPQFLDKIPAPEQKAAKVHGWDLCGLALEHLLQRQLSPPLNSRTRTAAGQWRERSQVSRSRGAVRASEFPTLFSEVSKAWKRLSSANAPTAGQPVTVRPYGRVVFPKALLDRS